jgi:hypothetical protein
MDEVNTSILHAVEEGEDEDEGFELAGCEESKSASKQPELRPGSKQEAGKSSVSAGRSHLQSLGSPRANRSDSSSDAGAGSSGRGRGGSSSSNNGKASSASTGGRHGRGAADGKRRATTVRSERGAVSGQTGGTRPYLLPALQVDTWSDLEKYRDAIHGAVWLGLGRLEELEGKRSTKEEEWFKSLQELDTGYRLRAALGSALRITMPVEGPRRREGPGKGAASGRDGVQAIEIVSEAMKSRDRLMEKLEEKDVEIRRLMERCHALELEKVSLANELSKRDADRKKRKDRNKLKQLRKKEKHEEETGKVAVGQGVSAKRRKVVVPQTAPGRPTVGPVRVEVSEEREVSGNRVTVGHGRVVGGSSDGW